MGYSNVAPFLVYAFVFYVMSFFITKYGDSSENCMVAVLVMMTASIAISNANAHTPDLARAKLALKKIFCILDKKTLIDPYAANEISGTSLEEFNCTIEFRHVWFKYPTRNEWVLKGISFIV